MTPSKKLVALRESMVGIRGKEALLSLICQVIGGDHTEYKYFNTKVSNHTWRGYVHLERDWLFGSLYTLWDNKPYIIRGYPKIKYVEASKVLNKEGVAEGKVDGTCLGIFNLPDASLMGKTRMGFRWDVPGYMGQVWSDLYKDTGLIENTKSLCDLDYLPFFEMYGERNPCEYVQYTVPIAAKLIDVVDMRTFKFLPYDKKVDFATKFELPIPRLHWKGTFTMGKISWLAWESEARVTIDGEEGLMAKWFDPVEQDQYLGKIKCDNIRALAIKLSGGAIPSEVINKAVRKAMEGGEYLYGDVYSLTIQELAEDWPDSKIQISMIGIGKLVRKRCPLEADKTIMWLNKQAEEGMEITEENKKVVLRAMRDSTLDLHPSVAYNLFQLYLRRKREIKRDR